MPKPRLRRKAVVWVACVIGGGVGLAWAGQAAWDAVETWGTPTCSWPLQVRGTASPAQAGLVRCYVRALANSDTTGLMAVADYIPPVRITKADLSHSTDARAGLATATLTQNPNDTASAFVDIVYADGARDDLGMINMVSMGGPSGWRMVVGTEISPGPSVPTTGPSPSSST